jgi:hypothetical protein
MATVKGVKPRGGAMKIDKETQIIDSADVGSVSSVIEDACSVHPVGCPEGSHSPVPVFVELPPKPPILVTHTKVAQHDHALAMVVTAPNGRSIATIKSWLDGYLWVDITYGMHSKVVQVEQRIVTSHKRDHAVSTTVGLDDGTTIEDSEFWID